MPHDPTPDGLSAKQRRAVRALPTAGEVTAAAEAGVHRGPPHRWLEQPAAPAAVRQAGAAALDESWRPLVRPGRTASAAAATARGDPTAPFPTRVREADAALGRRLQLRELASPEARVQALEEAAGAEGTGR